MFAKLCIDLILSFAATDFAGNKFAGLNLRSSWARKQAIIIVDSLILDL